MLSLSSQGMAQARQAAVDEELAMMVQNEMVAQQLAEEDQARANNANPLNLLGELVYGGLQQLAPATAASSTAQHQSQQRTAASSTASSSGGGMQGGCNNARAGPGRSGNGGSSGMGSHDPPGGGGGGGGGAGQGPGTTNRTSSFFSSFGEDVKRKMNEVGVKLQVNLAFTESNPVCSFLPRT
jgi:hypothetical protein